MGLVLAASSVVVGVPGAGPSASTPTVVEGDFARAAAITAGGVPTTSAAAAAPKLTLRISTFNVLGSLHTLTGTDESRMGPGRVRAEWAASIVRAHASDLVGLSEIQRDQLLTMMAKMPDFTFWPGTSLSGGVQTNVMWRTSRFDLVSGQTLAIPFVGQTRLMPIVLLREKTTGRQFYLFNAHNSPNRGPTQTNEAERDAQTASEIALIKQLRATGRPVFFVGDLNEHEEVMCKVISQTDLKAAAGGSYANGRCTPPKNMRADWIFGSNTAFSGYQADRGGLIPRTTDHAVPVTTATVS